MGWGKTCLDSLPFPHSIFAGFSIRVVGIAYGRSLSQEGRNEVRTCGENVFKQRRFRSAIPLGPAIWAIALQIALCLILPNGLLATNSDSDLLLLVSSE